MITRRHHSPLRRKRPLPPVVERAAVVAANSDKAVAVKPGKVVAANSVRRAEASAAADGAQVADPMVSHPQHKLHRLRAPRNPARSRPLNPHQRRTDAVGAAERSPGFRTRPCELPKKASRP